MHKKISVKRFRLLALDFNLFAGLSLQVSSLDLSKKPASVAMQEIKNFAVVGLGFDEGFVEALLSCMSLPDQDFFQTLKQHVVVRNDFVAKHIVPHKNIDGSDIADATWEKERTNRMKMFCEGCGLSKSAIALIMKYLHNQSKDTIKRELEKKRNGIQKQQA